MRNEDFKIAVLGYLAQIVNLLRHEEIQTEAEGTMGTDVAVFDAEGKPQTMQWAVERYGIEIVSATIPQGQVGYRVAQLQQKIGPCGMMVKVVNEQFDPTTTDPEKNKGTALEHIAVIQGWIGGQVLPADAAPRTGPDTWEQPEGKPNKGGGGFTNDNGDFGWGWGPGEQVPPGEEGPHWYWVMPGDYHWFSDVILNLGWVWGSDHDTLNIVFQRVAGTEPEPPEPPDDGDGDVAAAIRYLADTIAAGIPVRLTLG